MTDLPGLRGIRLNFLTGKPRATDLPVLSYENPRGEDREVAMVM